MLNKAFASPRLVSFRSLFLTFRFLPFIADVLPMVASPQTSFGVRSSRIHFSRMREERTPKDVCEEAIPMVNEPQEWYDKIQCTNRVLQVIKKNVGNRLI